MFRKTPLVNFCRGRALPLGGEKGERTGKVDDEEVDDELADLEGRKVLLPPDLVAGSGHEVVVVPTRACLGQLLSETELPQQHARTPGWGAKKTYMRTWTAKLAVMTTQETEVRPLS